jgi:hypothetical protein
MNFTYQDETHEYILDGINVPSLTGMLTADGLSAHLDQAPQGVVQAKAEWGSRLHLATQKAEYGYGVDKDFIPHCAAWLEICLKMGWGYPANPIWKKCEIPILAQVEGFVFGFTPDRAAPEAVVEIKGTYAPHISHSIQTALQVIGMGYSRSTPRFIAYFDKVGLKRLHQCGTTVKRDGQELNVYDEADRIIFEHAMAWEGKAA